MRRNGNRAKWYRRTGMVVVGAALALATVVSGVGTTGVASAAPGGTLWDGQVLRGGQYVESSSHQYWLVMQGDGNLVEYSGHTPVWATMTNNHPGAYAVLQRDGNLVVYSASNRALWATMTNGHSGDRAVVQNNGAVVIDSATNQLLWGNGTPGHLLRSGQFLRAGWYVSSSNRLYDLVMQSDGNLVEYADSVPIWASMTNGHPGSWATMEPNGDLVVFDSTRHVLWTSTTQGHTGASLSMQDDSNVVVYAAGRALWAASAHSLRVAIVALAADRVGYQDSPSGTFCNRFTAYWGTGSACSNPNRAEAWCADFAAWAWHAAGTNIVYGWSTGDVNGWAATFADWAMRAGTWHSARSGYRPEPGDVVVYGLNSAATYADHVGIVASAGPDGTYAPTVINGDWWPGNNGGVYEQTDETTASGTDRVSGYASPLPGARAPSYSAIARVASPLGPLASTSAGAMSGPPVSSPTGPAFVAGPLTSPALAGGGGVARLDSGLYLDGPADGAHYALSAAPAGTDRFAGSLVHVGARGLARTVFRYRASLQGAGPGLTVTASTGRSYRATLTKNGIALAGCGSYLAHVPSCSFAYHGHTP